MHSIFIPLVYYIYILCNTGLFSSELIIYPWLCSMNSLQWKVCLICISILINLIASGEIYLFVLFYGLVIITRTLHMQPKVSAMLAMIDTSQHCRKSFHLNVLSFILTAHTFWSLVRLILLCFTLSSLYFSIIIKLDSVSKGSTFLFFNLFIYYFFLVQKTILID